ncbi:MAG: hypothetical protein CVV27_06815 [Candidatus Melainabacteria bacterium HGW-Melainabacteria-1]|nr:MAG: hypothetical protein CVV27_06815 [Candidatus Melainabacteria bacterium HGW-Melainabacteria-1]
MRDFEAFEERYKQGLVNTASVPRVALLLYDRLLLLHKEAITCIDEPLALRRLLQQAHAIMSHLANLFMQSDDPAWQALHLSHDRQARQLGWLFRQPRVELSHLADSAGQIRAFQEAWDQQLRIRRRQPVTGLNVRRLTSNGL